MRTTLHNPENYMIFCCGRVFNEVRNLLEHLFIDAEKCSEMAILQAEGHQAIKDPFDDDLDMGNNDDSATL